MPRPLDDFLLDEELENDSDVEIEERRHRTRPIKKKRDDSFYYDDPCSSRDVSSLPINDIHQSSSDADISISPKQNKKKKKGKEDENGCSSEEERWLHAIESGKLEEIDDELKKIKHKNPKLMTARQRALLERKTDKEAEKDPFAEQLVSLPSGYREKVFTPEMLEDKAKKLLRRRQLADEKREHDKKKTMERLLKKSESKAGRLKRGSKIAVPRIMYINRQDIITVSMPADIPFPLNESKTNSEAELPKPVLCGVQGCGRIKRYSCSVTHVPLCSIECYKLNKNNH